MILVHGHSREAGVEHGRTPREGLPDQPMIPIAAANDERRDIVVKTLGEHEKVNEIGNLQLASCKRQLTQVAVPVLPAEINTFLYIRLPALGDHSQKTFRLHCFLA